MTKNLRKTEYLFITLDTYDRATKATLSRWVVSTIKLASRVRKTTSGRCRSTAANFALLGGMKLKDILHAGDWSQAKTFKKFYLADIQGRQHYATAILDAAS